MTAHRNRLHERKTGTKERSHSFNKKWINVIISTVGLLLILTIVYFSNKKDYWDGVTRLSLAIRLDTDDVTVAVFDPQAETITSVFIPKETQVNAAYDLGEWRMGSIWRLSQDEGMGGSLLAPTITKTFKFPTEAWSDDKGIGFVGGGYLDLIPTLFTPYQTNLSMGDKVALSLFSLKVKNTSRITYDMRDAGYLVEQKLTDGKSGYVTKGTPPARLSAIFADETVSSEKASIAIINGTGSSSLAQETGSIVEVLGAKVISVREDTVRDLCLVEGDKAITVHKLAQVFGCNYKITEDPGVRFYIGAEFSKRY